MTVPDYAKGLWNPYVAGVALGLVLLLCFYLIGSGLGASGAVARTAAVTAHAVAPSAVEQNGYFGRFFKPGKKHPFENWMVLEVIGVLLGGLVGALTAGRFKFGSIAKGPTASNGLRLSLAFIGGMFAGYGTRFAMGCTSGQGLSGGATLAVGSWLFIMGAFASAFVVALLVRREWA